MSSKSAQLADVSAELAFAKSVRTADGAIVDVSGDLWVVPSLSYRRRKFDFSQFTTLNERFLMLLKQGLLHHLQNKSASHFGNLFGRFLSFYREVLALSSARVDRIEIGHILTYRGTLDRKTEWKLGVIRILLTDLSTLGLGIASEEAMKYLNESTFRGNVKGTSIRTRDSQEGAFSDTELQAIQSALNNAYAGGGITLYDFAAAWILLSYGVRPVQIAALKECDLVVDCDEEAKRYELKMPRAKQQDSGIRGAFKSRYCSKQLGQLLEAVIANNQLQFNIADIDAKERPMFWSHRLGDLPGLSYHISSEELGIRTRTVINDLTGLKANAKRFRITLGQRSADNGVDKYTLAELLDHSDTQNVHVYYEASPEMALRLDKHMAMEMAPLAQAFAGVVVTTEADAPQAGRANRIYDRSLENNVDVSLGDCGQMSFCGLSVPFACYTCRYFKPFIDGPHEAFLDALLTDRERMVAEDYSPRIYTIRDRTILAVAEVIQLCEGMQEEDEE